MSKIEIPTIAGGYNLSSINEALNKLKDELNNKVLYRTNPAGEPNAMSQALDMNGEQILNLGAPSSPNSPARLSDIQPLVVGLAPASLVPFTPTGSLVSTTVQSAIVELDADVVALGVTGDATKGAGRVANSMFTAANRTLLKAVGTGVNTAVFLQEAGRAGLFIWTLGDYSTHIAADTQEGCYIKANAFSSTTGAWVRSIRDGEAWETDWFGVPNSNSDGTGTACHTQLSAMMAVANIAQPGGLKFGAGVYAFDAKPTFPTFICTFEGVEAGSQPTILVKRYADTAAGVLGGTTKAIRFRNVQFTAIGAGIVANNLAISAISGSSPVSGIPLLENVRTSMGTANANEILIDGLANTTQGTAGYRTGAIKGLQCFGNLVMRGCKHWFGMDSFIGGDFVVTGTSAVPSDDLHFGGVIGKNLDLGAGVDANGYVTRMTYHGNVVNSILNRVNCSRVLVFGDFATTAERNWDKATCRTYTQSSIADYGSNANGSYVKFGNGDIEQWGSISTVAGTGSVTFPVPFLSTVTSKSANVSVAPSAGFIEVAQAYSATLVGMSIRTMSFNTAPAAGLTSTTVEWYAKGQ